MDNLDELFDKYYPKSPTLHEKIVTYLQTANFAQSYHVIANEIVDIVSKHLPKEDTNPTFNTLHWNKAVKSMRNRLR
jgi:hypothetical protein